MSDMNSKEFRKKRDFLNQYADFLEGKVYSDGSDIQGIYSSTIHVDDAQSALYENDDHPERIPLGSRPVEEVVHINGGPVSVKKLKELLGHSED